METRPYVPWDLMERFLVDAFEGYGVPEADARICADVLLESDRRGIESHGCNRFKPIYIDRIVKGTLRPVTEIEVLKDTPTTLVYDAHDGMGMVASHHMMEALIEVRHGGWRHPQLHPLRHRRVLDVYGRERRHDRPDRHQRPALDRSHLRRGEHDGHQPPDLGHPHR